VLVAGEEDRRDLGLDAFADLKDDLFLARLVHLFRRGVDGDAFEAVLGVGLLDRFRGAFHERLLDRVADVNVDLVLLELLGDLVRLQLFVAAVFNGTDARTLFHDGADDDAAVLARLGLEADVVEETGLPEVEEVALERVGVVCVARRDAEVHPDRVACHRNVTGRFEAFDFSAGQRRVRSDGLRVRGLRRGCVGDDSACVGPFDDRSGFRLLRRGLLRCGSLGVSNGAAGEHGRSRYQEKSIHK
jgi:hypothetical protein